MAAWPSSIESWRKPAVLENTSVRKRAEASSASSTLTLTVRVRSTVPSDTVTSATYSPAAV